MLQEVLENALDAVFEGIRFLWEGSEQSRQYVLDKATGAVTIAKESAVSLSQEVIRVGDKAVSVVFNAGKFLTDEDYRKKEGIPWLKEALLENRDTLLDWMKRHRDFTEILSRRARGIKLDPEEVHRLRAYLKDLGTILPFMAIFLMPGGMVFLPLLNQLMDEILENSSDTAKS
ncbi:MAG: hypothetical protein D6767_00365 [Candidatus Hydrogenedentota bacterium]|nr:MAG: hypothetical protein D6767_00365 [Candidatus Hydrogenedentota bacterium]